MYMRFMDVYIFKSTYAYMRICTHESRYSIYIYMKVSNTIIYLHEGYKCILCTLCMHVVHVVVGIAA